MLGAIEVSFHFSIRRESWSGWGEVVADEVGAALVAQAQNL
jgi:hypothetical protein